MPSFFGRQPGAKPSIESLRFNTAGWTYHGEREPGRMRIWETPDHDAVMLHFFGITPDLPRVSTVGELSANYISQLSTSKAKFVECTVKQVAKQPAVLLMVKAPQVPSGLMYQGTFTLPFRDFSFVIKMQCPEFGTTGIREALLTDGRLRAGETPNLSGSGPIFPEWNPDAPTHDADFPLHPVSRLRRLLERVATTASLDDSIRRLPAFPLPGSTQ